MALFKKTPHPILERQPDLPWANGVIFNPGAWYEEGTVHLLFRAIPKGYRRISLPDPDGPREGFDEYISYIGYASSRDGVRFEYRAAPFIEPDADFDRFGAEDPRISRIDDEYLITYTALSQPAFGGLDGVRIGLAATKDFQGLRKHGVIGPPVQDKDAVIFPRRIGGRIAMLHRVAPDIQLVYFDSLEQLFNPPEDLWRQHLATLDEHVVMRPETDWEAKKIGAGPTPIETEEGWLLIYHGVDSDHVYRAGLALLDLDNPRRVLARTAAPVMEPEADYELYGDVNNVVFPEGAVIIDDTLHVYYGAADRVVGHASASLSDILAVLREEQVRGTRFQP